jgi:hypothetical protein
LSWLAFGFQILCREMQKPGSSLSLCGSSSASGPRSSISSRMQTHQRAIAAQSTRPQIGSSMGAQTPGEKRHAAITWMSAARSTHGRPTSPLVCRCQGFHGFQSFGLYTGCLAHRRLRSPAQQPTNRPKLTCAKPHGQLLAGTLYNIFWRV